MSDLKPGQYAIFDTTMGEVTCELFPDKAPVTVQNFVGLATGTREFVDPQTRERTKRPFYDGLTFHRVIPRFMIQGGCPLGSGTGGPGYKFQDEFAADDGGTITAVLMTSSRGNDFSRYALPSF